MRRTLIWAFAAVAIGLAVTAIGGASAQAVKAGTLSCDVSGGLGLIIASKKAVNCHVHAGGARLGAGILYRLDQQVRPRHRRDDRARK